MKSAMEGKTGRWLVFSIALILMLFPVLLTVLNVLKYTSGTFSYPLDDTFIHMTLARNLVEYHNWGIHPHEFGPASSSPLYTLLLAGAYVLFPEMGMIPLYFNLVAGVLVVYYLQKFLSRQGLSPLQQLPVLGAAVVLTPLSALILVGMEHTLHCLFAIVFLDRFSRATDFGGGQSKSNMIWLMLVTVGLTGLRYESLFLIAAAGWLLLVKRKFWLMALLLMAAMMPVLVFGLYSVRQGGYFLPNPVLLKTIPAHFSGKLTFLEFLYVKLLFPSDGLSRLVMLRLLLVLMLTYLVCYKFYKEYLMGLDWLLMITGQIMLHLLFAGMGNFYRYEAYLIFLSVAVLGLIFMKMPRIKIRLRFKIITLLILFLAFWISAPLLLRAWRAIYTAPRACKNIFEQQVQMGRFVEKYYLRDAVAVNDIGYVSYCSKGDVLDLVGIGDMELAREKLNRRLTSSLLNQLVEKRNVKLIMVYDSWFEGLLPGTWVRVGSWKIENNIICGSDTVTFYALKEEDALILRENMSHFQAELPAGVRIDYAF